MVIRLRPCMTMSPPPLLLLADLKRSLSFRGRLLLDSNLGVLNCSWREWQHCRH